MYPVEIKSRDGLNLISYLTLPHGVKEKNGIPNKPVPMILFVHGGPMARDSWDFLRSVQRLANRGYAVLQVNYRGSTGFGKNFIKAGHKQHWDKVAEDLQDAVTWAVKQKIADPKKICIMGGSYGGYQALVGITKYPDHYNCAIDIVGMSNLVTDIESDPPYWESVKHLTLKMYGDHTTTEGRNELLRMSPISYVDRIKTPLLIAHGQNDPRVKKSESDQVVKALQDKKIPVTYVLFPDEGHGFANPNNRIAFDAVTEKFLAVHLGGRFEPIGNDLEKSTARILANDINDKAMEKRLEHPAEFIGHE
jgi:dipeptidyl aminopeptidase/acylaminoacyl peptidase